MTWTVPDYRRHDEPGLDQTMISYRVYELDQNLVSHLRGMVYHRRGDQRWFVRPLRWPITAHGPFRTRSEAGESLITRGFTSTDK